MLDNQASDTPLSPEEVHQLASKIKNAKMSSLAVFFLEAHRPLANITVQAMIFFEPFALAFVRNDRWSKLQRLLSNQESIETLISALETA